MKRFSWVLAAIQRLCAAVQRQWADSGSRRRLVLGFYSVLLIAVGAAVVGLVLAVMSSQSGSFSDRLAQTGDWLAGGTLAFAAIAGLVALQAYASATGLPDLLLSVLFQSDSDLFWEGATTAQPVSVPAKFGHEGAIFFGLRNMSAYSARNPALVVVITGAALKPVGRDQMVGWTVLVSDRHGVVSLQWDGGPVYSIHGGSLRRVQLNFFAIEFVEAAPTIHVELLAEGYRREVMVPLPLPYDFGSDGIGWLPLPTAETWV